MSPVLKCQTVTVTAPDVPDESITASYMTLDSECRSLVHKQNDPVAAATSCRKLADEADKFAPQSHYVVRRGAYVFFAIALMQAKNFKEAVKAGDKAVAVVSLGHDDESGSSAAYGVRGKAKALAGDLNGADKDLEKAETFERNGLNTPAGHALKTEYSKTLQNLLRFHAQVLAAMGNQSAAQAKEEEAGKL